MASHLIHFFLSLSLPIDSKCGPLVIPPATTDLLIEQQEGAPSRELAPGRGCGLDAEARVKAAEPAQHSCILCRAELLWMSWSSCSPRSKRWREKENLPLLSDLCMVFAHCWEHTPGTEPEMLPFSPSSHHHHHLDPRQHKTYFVSGLSSHKSCISVAELFTRGRKHAQRNPGV